MFSLISFLKNFSRMKRRWREKSQLPVAIKRSFLSSYKWKKLFESCRQLRLLSKQILCQSYITFQIIFTQEYLRALDIPVFTKWIWFTNSFNCVYDGNVWPPGQRAEICERIVSESLRKIRTKFYGVAGHVGRVKTVVSSHEPLTWDVSKSYTQGSRTQYSSEDKLK